MLKSVTFTILLTFFVAACGQDVQLSENLSNNSPESSQDQKVTDPSEQTRSSRSSEQQALEQDDETTAETVGSYEVPNGFLASLDYLPWALEANICHYRTYYMAMDLAYAGLSSHSLYVFGRLIPEPDVEWRFHVTTLYIDPETREPYLLDPALNDMRPIPLDEWLDSIGKLPGENYTYLLVDGSATVEQRRDDPSIRIDRQALDQKLAAIDSTRPPEEMVRFTSQSINRSCFWTNHRWGLLRPGSETYMEVTTKLKARTLYLENALSTLGLLDYDPLEEPAGC